MCLVRFYFLEHEGNFFKFNLIFEFLLRRVLGSIQDLLLTLVPGFGPKLVTCKVMIFL